MIARIFKITRIADGRKTRMACIGWIGWIARIV